MPVHDAIASPLNLLAFRVARLLARPPTFSVSLCRRDSESALEKSFLWFARLSELAPSGAYVEGLIQAARCRTRCVTEWLAPAFGGLYSHGGLFSPVMGYLHSLEELKQARTVFTLPVPSGRFRTQYLPTAVKDSCQDVFYFFSYGRFPNSCGQTFSDTLLNRPGKPPLARDHRAPSPRRSSSPRSDPCR